MPSISVITRNGSGNARSAITSSSPPSGATGGVEHLVDHRLHPRRQLLDHPRRERLLHQPAEPGVVGRVEVEDAPGAPSVRPAQDLAAHLLAGVDADDGPVLDAQRRGRGAAGRSRRSGRAPRARAGSAAPGWWRRARRTAGTDPRRSPPRSGLNGFRLTGHISHSGHQRWAGEKHEHDRRGRGPGDPRLPGQPDRRGRGRAALRRARAGVGAERRQHRRPRGRRAARRRRALRRQGRAHRGRAREHRDRRRRRRARRLRPAPARRRARAPSTAPTTSAASAPTRSSACRSPRPRPRPTRPSSRCTATSAARTRTCCRCR